MVRAISVIVALLAALVVIPMMLTYPVNPFYPPERMEEAASRGGFTAADISNYLAEAHRVETHWADFKAGRRSDLLPLMAVHLAIQDLRRVPAAHERHAAVAAVIHRLAAIHGPVAQAWEQEGARAAQQVLEEGRKRDSQGAKEPRAISQTPSSPPP